MKPRPIEDVLAEIRELLRMAEQHLEAAEFEVRLARRIEDARRRAA